MATTVVCLFLLLASTRILSLCGQDFDPITENVALRASYKLEVFTSSELDSVSELQEEYHYNLASSRVDLRRQYWNETGDKIMRRTYLYDGINRVDVEVIGNNNQINGLSGLQLEDNGGSSSYSHNQVTFADNETPKVRLTVTKAADSLDEIVFWWNTTATKEANPKESTQRLNLSSFLSGGCLEKANSKLKHIRGLSRLLHLIECRRQEFLLVFPDEGHRSRTRGVDKYLYRATNLPALTESCDHCVHWLNITVSLIDKLHSLDGGTSQLPKRALPTSLSLEFGLVTMIINVYQLETVGAGAHLSESGSGRSNFILPLGGGVGDLLMFALARQVRPQPDGGVALYKEEKEDTNKQQKLQNFSFRAALTGGRVTILDPIELSVAYDGFTHKLARQISVVDRGQVVDDSWNRHTTRTVYDGQAKIKYHVKHSNDDYFSGSSSGPAPEEQWTDCTTDRLNINEAQALEDGGIEAFLLGEVAVFMGMALVRGIPCFVYERRLLRLPLWLDFGLINLASFDTLSKVHATFYVGANEIPSNISSQYTGPNGHSHLYRIVFTVSIENLHAKMGEEERTSRLSYNLELYNFHWSTRLTEEMPGLFDIGQDCFYSQPDARYLRMGLRMESADKTSQVDSLLVRLREEDSLRDELISRALSLSLGIVQSQQTHLETNYWPPDNSLGAKLSVYELPRSKVTTQFIGYAKDLSSGSAQTGSWSVGATSLSLEECQWRALHALKLPPTRTACDHQKECYKIIMYCPTSLHCLLSEAHEPGWKAIEKMEPAKIESVLMYPEQRSQLNKCHLVSVELNRQEETPMALDYGEPTQSSGLVLDWLLVQKKRLQMEPIKLEDAHGGGLPLTMKISELSLSNIIKVADESGALVEPLHGLGYDTPAGFEPIQVASVAHCSRACFVQHNCESYSVCHHGIHLECQLTSVNWTEPLKVAQLRELAQSPIDISSNRRKLVFEVQLENGQSAQVQLQRSSLCYIYTSRHLDLFQLEESSVSLGLVGGNLLSAQSNQECARYCMARAYLLASLNNHLPQSDNMLREPQQQRTGISSDESPTYGGHCESFRYSPQLGGICQLLSGDDHEELTIISEFKHDNELDLHALAELNKWRRSLEVLKSQIGARIVEARFDSYKLDHEQLFVAHPNQYLTFPSAANGSEWQAKYINTAFKQCAELCLRRVTCRSFDLSSESTIPEYQEKEVDVGDAGARVDTCFLNAFDLHDISQQPDLKFGLKMQTESNNFTRNNDKLWWHYEFNNIALHITAKLSAANYNSPPTDSILIKSGVKILE